MTLSLHGINQFYGDSHTVWDLTIDVPEGSCTCLMGRNGAGKTTTLKCIMGLLPIRTGEIRLDDTVLSNEPAERRARLGIGYVPQGREIFPRLTVDENLHIGFAVRDKEAEQRAYEKVLELFPVLGQMLKRFGGDLSGGQQWLQSSLRAMASWRGLQHPHRPSLRRP